MHEICRAAIKEKRQKIRNQGHKSINTQSEIQNVLVNHNRIKIFVRNLNKHISNTTILYLNFQLFSLNIRLFSVIYIT